MGKFVASSLVVGAIALANASAQTAPSEADSVRVQLDAGAVIGLREDGVAKFRGIPFAKPPVGELRWKPPEAPDSWAGDRYAITYEPPCPQPVNPDGVTPNGGGVAGMTSEDCLYLNVTAPENATNAPVRVWLYGGASFLGAGHLGSYNAVEDAKQGIVSIAINYRLGSLGVFAHPALTAEAGPDAPIGNYALMDAIEALRWVQRNAEAFGGDPNNVTLSGQSAGGIMTLDLMGIPEAEGLFDKAIIQSGSFLANNMSLDAAEAKGLAGAAALGLERHS